MSEPWDVTLDERSIEVRKFAHRKRSNLDRTVDRMARAAPGVRRPRHDAEIMRAWLARSVRRTPNVYPVDEAKVDYQADPTGRGATWVAFVRAVEARDEFEREFFGRRIILPPHLNVFHYMVSRGRTPVR